MGKKRSGDTAEEMARIEKTLLGSLYSQPNFGAEGAEDLSAAAFPSSAPLFFTDRSGGDDEVVYEEDLEPGAVIDTEDDRGVRKPAWVDEEEETTNISITGVNRLRKLRKVADDDVISGKEYVSRLRAQHVKLNPGTDWARADPNAGSGGSDYDEDDESESGITVTDDIIRSSEELVVKSNDRLLPGVLEYSRLVDANAVEPSNGPINSVQFHRNAQLLLTAGLDRRLRFFQVDGKRNAKIESIFLDDCPVRKASFLPDGSQVIISGRRKFFYSFDLVKAKVDKIGPLTGREENSIEVFEVSPDSKTVAFVGNEGYILLVSPRTKELIGTLKMNGSARSLAFSNDGEVLLSNGGDGHIYHWDLRVRRCINKAVDDGCITGSALGASPDSSLFASGSSSGIVNIYRNEEFLGGKRKPLKIVDNLTTTIDQLKFNHDAQLLAIISSLKRNSLKLLHIPSFTVFSNFPNTRGNMQYPQCLDFSPAGGFVVIGNAAGKVLLYKLHHYQNA